MSTILAIIVIVSVYVIMNDLVPGGGFHFVLSIMIVFGAIHSMIALGLGLSIIPVAGFIVCHSIVNNF